jgi:multiple antibiotic resistance protein
METHAFLTMVVGLFAITGTIANLPLFVAVTDGQAPTRRRRTAMVVAIVYLVFGVIALFAGNAALDFLGVRVAALRVAGMAVVLVIGWRMLNAPTPIRKALTAKGNEDGYGVHELVHAASNTTIPIGAGPGSTTEAPPINLGVMPLGFPIYAGPGMLSVVIAWGSGNGPIHLAAVAAILINAALIVVFDVLAAPLTKLAGAEALLVTEKVFGLLVVAIAVGGMASALLVLFPGLAGAVRS